MGFGLMAVVSAMVLMALQGVMEDVPEPGEDVIREDDTVVGSDDDDVIMGNGGAELLLPDDGNDLVRGGGGNDTISDLRWDEDAVMTDAGAVNPNWSNDTLFGGTGDDVITATGGQDDVNGGTGDDRINTIDLHPDQPFAPDRLFGAAGDDWLVGDDGDTMIGGEGTDFFSNLIDEPEDQPVMIRDWQRGEQVELLLYHPSLIPADGSAPVAELRDSDEGAVLSVNGHDAAVFSDALARDLNGHVRVVSRV